jgi:hypothetical protein
VKKNDRSVFRLELRPVSDQFLAADQFGRSPFVGATRAAGSGASGNGLSAPAVGAFPFGVSFDLGISFGGVTGVAGAAGEIGAVPHGDAAQQPGVGSQQESFRDPSRDRIRSRRLGFSQQVAAGHAGAGSQHDVDLDPNRALNRSRRRVRPAVAHGSQKLGAGAAAQQPPVWTAAGARSPHPAGITSPPDARADDITRSAAFTRTILLFVTVSDSQARNCPGIASSNELPAREETEKECEPS